MSKKKRPHGHYCKICGEYKANEKFSGKGHAAHICKSCSRLRAAEKSGGNGYKPDDEFSNAAAFRRREEMAARKNARSMPGSGRHGEGDLQRMFSLCGTQCHEKAACHQYIVF